MKGREMQYPKLKTPFRLTGLTEADWKIVAAYDFIRRVKDIDGVFSKVDEVNRLRLEGDMDANLQQLGYHIEHRIDPWLFETLYEVKELGDIQTP